MSVTTHLSAAIVALALVSGAANAADQNSPATSREHFSTLNRVHAVQIASDDLAAVRGTNWVVRVYLDSLRSIVSVASGKGPSNSPHWQSHVWQGMNGIVVGPYKTP